MKGIPCFRLLALVLLAQAASEVARGEAPAPVDPAIFVMPAGSPGLREVLQGAEWEKRFNKALADLGDLEKLKASELPSAGQRVDRVDAGGPGDTLGLKAGDIIRDIDGQPICQKEFRQLRQGRPQQMTVVRPDGRVVEMSIQPGPVGFNGRPMVRPELVYLRQGVRLPAWDALAAVGAARCFDDPDLAETAWNRALHAGYKPDCISEYCGAQLEWRQGRPILAMAYCAMLNKREGVPEAFDIQGLSGALAVANFKLEQAIAGRLVVSPPAGEQHIAPERIEWLKRLLKFHRSLPDAERFGRSPNDIASGAKSDILNDMEPWPNENEKTNGYRYDVRDWLAHAKPLPMQVPGDHYQVFPEVPMHPAGDVELIVRVKMKIADPLPPNASSAFMVSLIDGDQSTVPDRDGDAANRHRAFLSAWVEGWGMSLVEQAADDGHGVIVAASDAGEAVSNNRQFTFRLVHAAGREEVWLDHRRLVYLPAASNPRKIGFRLYATGVNVETRTNFSKLDPNPPGGK